MSVGAQDDGDDERGDPDIAVAWGLAEAFGAGEEVDRREQEGEEGEPAGAVAGSLELFSVDQTERRVGEQRNEPRERLQENRVEGIVDRLVVDPLDGVRTLGAQDGEIDEYEGDRCEGERPNQTIVDLAHGHGWG